MKSLSCREAGVSNCDYVARGSTEEELFENARQHGKSAHGMSDLTSDLKSKLRPFIRDEKVA